MTGNVDIGLLKVLSACLGFFFLPPYGFILSIYSLALLPNPNKLRKFANSCR
jgi:hypothetical protein